MNFVNNKETKEKSEGKNYYGDNIDIRK